MSELADKIVTEARSWKGTRFRYQGRLKGIGIDCAGFISEVVTAAGIKVAIPADYSPHTEGGLMVQLLDKHMDMVESMRPGDVIAFCDEALQNRNLPRHLAFVTEIRTQTTFIIHASQHGVREHRTDAQWLKRIHSIWRFKNA